MKLTKFFKRILLLVCFTTIYFSTIAESYALIKVGTCPMCCDGPCDMIDLGLAASIARKGEIISIWPGTYNIDNANIYETYVTLQAEKSDPSGVIIKPVSESSKGFYVDYGGSYFGLPLNYGVKFSWLTFEGFKTYAVFINGWKFDLLGGITDPTKFFENLATVSPEFDNCTFKYNSTGIDSTQNTNLIISNSKFIANEVAIRGERTSLILTKNQFINNGFSGGGAILIDGDTDNLMPQNIEDSFIGTPSEISENTFYNNYQAININNSLWDIAILGNDINGTAEDSTMPGISITGRKWNSAIISNNIVLFQNGSGILFSNNQDSIRFKSSIDHNIVTGNIGIGIEVSSSSPDIYNNTIAENALDGLSLSKGNPKEVYNNIIINNVGAGIRTSGYKLIKPKISYNNVWNNVEGNYIGNISEGGPGSISEDPIFPGAILYFYALGIYSPCVDAGKTSKNVENDPDSTPPDMGALFQDQRADNGVNCFENVCYHQAMTPEPILARGDKMYIGLFVINRSGGNITRAFGHFCFDEYGEDCKQQIFDPQPDIFDVTVNNQSHIFTIRQLEIVSNAPYGNYILQTMVDYDPLWFENSYFYVFPSLNISEDGKGEESNTNDKVDQGLMELSNLNSSSGGCATININNSSSESLCNLFVLILVSSLLILIKKKKIL